MDEEAFDVDAFCETLFAYMPSTTAISPEEITEWMFSLAKEERDRRSNRTKIQLDLKSVIEQTAMKGQRKSSESSDLGPSEKQRTTERMVSESSESSSDIDVIATAVKNLPSFSYDFCFRLMNSRDLSTSLWKLFPWLAPLKLAIASP